MMTDQNKSVEISHIDSTQPRRSKKIRLIRIIGLVLILAGVVIIAYPASTFLVTNRAQGQLRSDWDKIVKETTKNLSKTTKTSTEGSKTSDIDENNSSNEKKIPPGKAAFRLIIPKINLDRIVVQGTEKTSLKMGPGHMVKTVLPGEPGVSVVSGHRTTYGAPFFRLDLVKNNDEIIVETATSRLVFIVYNVLTVNPNNASFISKTGDPIIALTTCTPIYSARQRLVVLAKLKD